MRKNLHGYDDLTEMPSFLGHIFRIAAFGYDDFNYMALVNADDNTKLQKWMSCRHRMGMFSSPSENERQQYMDR
jgi:hypothetical protein